jgi:pimeloyl-ACP methyl ester carboxylesterase
MNSAAFHDNQPVVILGGLFSAPGLYLEMKTTLHELTGQPVFIVDVQPWEWFLAVSKTGWSRILIKLDKMVRRALEQSNTGKVTIVGHSAGGVISRLYLSPKPFQKRAYHGLDYVDQIITLGSPHYNKKGAFLRRWVEEKYPGAYFYPEVKYFSIAGKSLFGNPHGSPQVRVRYSIYKYLTGNGKEWGDGVVPLASALLNGSMMIILEGVKHYSFTDEDWYGKSGVVKKWWQELKNSRMS